jgi:modulator of FtsH protease
MYRNAEARTRMGAFDAFSRGIPAELTTFVQKTYGLLAFTLVLAAGASIAVMKLFPPILVQTTAGDYLRPGLPQWAIWAFWGGTFLFGMIGNASARGARQGETSVGGLLALCAMVICAGAMLAPTLGLLAGYGMTDVIVAAAVTTAVAFSVLTGFVFVTGKNFSFMGGFITVAGAAFFVAWLLNYFFFQSANAQWWMAAVGAILFSAKILFDTSSVVRFYGPENLVVPAVVTLFIDIFNLFVMLLILLSGRRRD